MKKYEIINAIKKSTRRLCLHCYTRKCCKCHSISKNMYLNNIVEDGHVIGNFKQKGCIDLDYISVNDASSFYNFCNNCDKLFKPLDDNILDINNKKQIFLLYYRMIAANLHQLIQEYHFFYSINSSSNNKETILKEYKSVIKDLMVKFFMLRSEMNKNNYSVIMCKTFVINKKINFVYFNTIKVAYDLKLNKIAGCPLLNINIFNQGNITKIVLTWEQKDYIALLDYLFQLTNLNKEELERYFSNIMVAFSMNLYFKPSTYFRWTKKDIFNKVKKVLPCIENTKCLYEIINNNSFLNLFDFNH